MNRDNILKWVEALESGEYEQTYGALQFNEFGEGDKFCCLGVACEVAIKDGLNLSVTSEVQALSTLKSYGAQEDRSTLPFEVMEWLGLSVNPFVHAEGPGSPGRYHQLTTLNDSFKFTFAQIAALIRTEFLTETEEL